MSDTMKIQVSSATIIRNEAFIEKANRLRPSLNHEEVSPARLVKVVPDEEAVHGWRAAEAEKAEELESQSFGKGDCVILDFGDHRVGTLSLGVRPVGSPPDAPLKLKITFGEMPVEMAVPFATYNGWISSSWLQEETLVIDVLPAKLTLPRRYSFRYAKLEVLDTSAKYRVAFENVSCRTVTSADSAAVRPLEHSDAMLRAIDRISIRTLEDCMQEVFEDGPKRDRRLWLGDLRLQALANYETFGQNELVKRCLYLFAAVPDERGRIAANLFVNPNLIADDTYLFDYSLFFTTTLADYYEATNDISTLNELWPLALRQIELALERLDSSGIVKDEDSWWSFIDWHEQLNKQAPSQGVLIYAMKSAIRLARQLDRKSEETLSRSLKTIEEATIKHLWDPDKGLFVSGKERQISWASQVWLALAEVLPADENRELMVRTLASNPEIGPTTPYMYHHLIEALVRTGCRDSALEMLKRYWGAMVEMGADTFWELFDPNDSSFSPYGSPLINSYCHAWSCTPTYLIRRFGL